jgi:hypothetical protein
MEQEEAFVTLKKKLCSETFLAVPNSSEEFIVTTDASDSALSAI